MLTPQSMEASTQKPIDDSEGRRDKVEPQKSFKRWRYHYVMSLKAVSDGNLQVKFEWALLKEAVRQDKEGR